MNNLKFDLEKYRKKPEKKMAHSEWQDRASKAVEQMKTPKRYISQVYKFFKKDRTKAEQALRYIQERKDIHTPTRYFIWLMTH